MKLSMELEVKEITTVVDEFGSIAVKLKTGDRMNKSIISTLLRYTNLNEIVKSKMIECIIENKRKILERIELNKKNGTFSPEIGYPALKITANGNSILAVYRIGTYTVKFSDIIENLQKI